MHGAVGCPVENLQCGFVHRRLPFAALCRGVEDASDVIGSVAAGVVVVPVLASPDAGGAAGAPAIPPIVVAAPAATREISHH
jgi:hypothetical protein